MDGHRVGNDELPHLEPRSSQVLIVCHRSPLLLLRSGWRPREWAVEADWSRLSRPKGLFLRTVRHELIDVVGKVLLGTRLWGCDSGSPRTTAARRPSRHRRASCRRPRAHCERALEELDPELGECQPDRRRPAMEQVAWPEPRTGATQDIEEAAIRMDRNTLDRSQGDVTATGRPAPP